MESINESEIVNSQFHNWLYDTHASIGAALCTAQDGFDSAAIELAIQVAVPHHYNRCQMPNPEMGVRGKYEGLAREVAFLSHLHKILTHVVFCLNQGVVIPQSTGKTMDTLWEWYDANDC